jgi:predicted lipoprotein with Yx(FWY)xxD motif
VTRLIAVLMAIALLWPLAVRGTSAQDASILKVTDNPDLGAILTDAEGKTLYLFTPDTTAGESACNDDCAQNWPPLEATDSMTLPAGVPGELSSFDRADGKKQLAYNDIPLYYFAQDDEAGDAYGEGVGGKWFVVHPGAELGSYPAAPGEGTPVPASTLRVGFTPELGPLLTDAEGHTVYLFAKDTTVGQSSCEGDCASAWPAVPAADMAMLPPGIQGTLGSIDRSDGSKQLTYNDIPLYFYAEDDEAGDTYGQGKGDVWFVVAPGAQFSEVPSAMAATPAA